jgi:hypothetical protein
MDANLGPPPPYSVEDTRPQHIQDAPPNTVHRKPVPELTKSQRNRYQRSHQELRSPSQTTSPPNLQHQRSFQGIHASPERGNPPLNRYHEHEPYQNSQPPFELNYSQQNLNQRPFQYSHHLSERAHRPTIRHQGSHQDLRVPSVTSNSPRLHYQMSFQGTPTSPDPSTPRIRYQRSYQDFRAETDSQPEMKHLRLFRGGRPGEDAESEKLPRNEPLGNPELPPRTGLSLRTTIPPRFTEYQIYDRPQSSGTVTPHFLPQLPHPPILKSPRPQHPWPHPQNQMLYKMPSAT